LYQFSLTEWDKGYWGKFHLGKKHGARFFYDFDTSQSHGRILGPRRPLSVDVDDIVGNNGAFKSGGHVVKL
jgi:hypothetical protein